jgi:antitoxin (DNA-binding transcriptional repressor) of toxin-antitoxin stability system
MKTVSLRMLHEQTGLWMRRAASQPFMVTDRGRPIAEVHPFSPHQNRKPLPDRSRLIARIPDISVDSTDLVGEERARA